MITFKSTDDLNKLPTNDPAHPPIKELIDQLIKAYTWEGHPYNAEGYGYIVLIKPEDTERVLDEIRDDWTILDIPWEGIMRKRPPATQSIRLICRWRWEPAQTFALKCQLMKVICIRSNHAWCNCRRYHWLGI